MNIPSTVEMLHQLFRKVWEQQAVPKERKEGHLVKMPKKCSLALCSDWRGITLLPVPGEVLTKVILERLKTTLDETLRDDQAGFRAE